MASMRWEAVVPLEVDLHLTFTAEKRKGSLFLMAKLRSKSAMIELLLKQERSPICQSGRLTHSRNESNTTAKMLITIAPAGLEQMFFEVSSPLPQGSTTAPHPTKEEIESFWRLLHKYGVEIRLPKH